MNNLSTHRIFVSLFGITIGIYLTYILVQKEIVTPVIASAFVGLVASICYLKKSKFSSELALAMYCGSFAGMGNVLNAKELLLTTSICTLFLISLTNYFKGFGGKLGFIAFISSILTFSILHFQKIDVNTILKIERITELNEIVSICLSSGLGFLTTILLHHKQNKSAVFASAFPSLFIGLVCYFLNISNGNLIAATFFSASFVGMLSKDIFQKKMYWYLIPIHCIIIILFKNSLGKFGGALGTLAFVAVSLTYMIDKSKKLFFRS